MTKKLSVVVISVTPFAEDGSLDEVKYRQQLRRLGDAGCSVYVAGSGTSEAYTFTDEERDRAMVIAVAELGGKTPVRAMGCEPRTAREMIDFVRAAERSGIDAAQIFSLEIGHLHRPTIAELDRYYSSVIESTSIPIYLSSHIASGYHLPIELVERLVDRFPQIAGIAYFGSEIAHIGELIARVGDRIEVHCAGPDNAMAVLALGGNGFMGGEGNFSPEMSTSVISAWQSGDREAIKLTFGRLMAFAKLYLRYGGGGGA